MQLKFLIYISYSYSIPIGEPLEKEIQNQNHQIQWFADQIQGRKELINKANSLTSIQDCIDYKPDIVLTITNNVPSFVPGLKVQIFHGFNAKKRKSSKTKFSHFKIRGLFDLYCTQGPSTTKYFKYLAQQHKHFLVKETGWSKMDPLFSCSSEKIEPEYILISSTFTRNLSLAHNHNFYLKIRELIKTKNFNFIMAIHPKMDLEIVKKWRALNCEHFQLEESVNLIPIFKKSKLLIADTTSTIQEFLLLNRPIITFNNNNQPNYALNINDQNVIEAAINNYNKWHEKLAQNQKIAIKNIHPYKDGKSSSRVINTCIEILNSRPKLKNKPINIIRKLKLRKQFNYWKI